MIKANELRIANYVGFFVPEKHEMQIGRIDGIELDYDDIEYKIRVPAFSKVPITESGINPVPLTEEWLLKFGFEKTDRDYYEKFGKDESIHIGIFVMLYNQTLMIEDDYYETVNLKAPEYVHELQNLYHAITGEELTIKQDAEKAAS